MSQLLPGNPMQTSIAVSTSNLESYIASAYQIPVLNAEEEHALALRLHERNDLDAARTLIVHHLRFVIQVARGYSGYGLPLFRSSSRRKYWSHESCQTI